MHGLNGKVVIVTGAAGTPGQAMAQRLLAESARVVATDLREGSIELPAEAMTLQHDVTDAASWDRVIAAATRQFGAVDAVVNNAGLPGRHSRDEGKGRCDREYLVHRRLGAQPQDGGLWREQGRGRLPVFQRIVLRDWQQSGGRRRNFDAMSD
jgi:NAD(P)-dependent dehydrogenase (short-subunit alcohol dehydrogenase family)